MQDWQLLRDYVERDSQVAFGRLVERYLNLVYATCLREVGEAALAEDVTQVVFLLLARKAATFNPNIVLAGWLFQTARFAAKNARRREDRWRRRTQHAVEAMMDEEKARISNPDAAWQQLEPLVHEGLFKLSAVERNAVLLRCFEGRSLKETGAALGLTEEAARKRVTRALEKLRRYFTQRGVTLSVVVLAALLSTEAVKAAPLSAPTLAHAVLSASPGTITIGGLSAKAQALVGQTERALLLGKAKIGATALGSVIIALLSTHWALQQRLRAPPVKVATRLAQRLTPSIEASAARNTPPLPPPATVSQNPKPRVERRSERQHAAPHNKEKLPMKNTSRIALALSAASLLSVPALADGINARIKVVDPAIHTITVIEGQKDYVFTITPLTKFVNAQGDVLATGFKMGNNDTLEVGIKSGALKAGTRLSITYHNEQGKSLASEVKLRDRNREAPKK